MAIYVNGVSKGTTSKAGTIDYTGGSPLTLGAKSSTGATPFETFHGYLDDMRIYNRGLSAAEILSLYNASLTGYQNGVLNFVSPSLISLPVPPPTPPTGVPMTALFGFDLPLSGGRG